MVVAKRADPKALASAGCSAFLVLVVGVAVSLASTGVVEVSVVDVDAVFAFVALVRLGLALGLAAALAALTVLASGWLPNVVSLGSVIIFLCESGEGINGFFAWRHESVGHGLNGGGHRGAGLSPGIYGSHFGG